jgi:cyclomaltodextrinase
LLLLFQFCFPGAPGIYYGDEVGVEGGKDPGSRRAFPWDESSWDLDLRAFVRNLIRLRHSMTILRRGDYQRVLADDDTGAFAFARRWEGESVAVVLNASDSTRTLVLPASSLGWRDGETVVDALRGGRRAVSGGQVRLRLPAYEGVLLHRANRR